MASTTEHERLQETRERNVPWRKWGPYLSERQWGTVREDYSDNGDAWNYFTHDQARSRAYRWGEDGLAGICDDQQRLCFALALWNGKDPILKERLFGLTNSEGNHGEDVKEYYFYLDSTPTHSYMKYLYKYPQAAYPYSDLVATNRRRSRSELEYELLDTGVFDDDRYFDVFVEYAKAAPEDMLIRITVCNRGPEAAPLHVLPTLWFRNTWSWPDGGSKPVLQAVDGAARSIIHAHHTDPLFQESLDDYDLYCEGRCRLLFTENETNNARLFGTPNAGRYVKDGIDDAVVHGQQDAVNPRHGHQSRRAHYQLSVQAGETQVVRLRLTRTEPRHMSEPFGDVRCGLRRRACKRRMSFTRLHTAVSVDETQPTSCDRRSPACSGASSITTSMPTRWLGEHHAHPLRRRAAPSATANGSTWSTTTSSRCPINGSIPGMRPGIWPFTPSRWPPSTRISPSSSSISC